jgi:hypothetical protein
MARDEKVMVAVRRGISGRGTEHTRLGEKTEKGRFVNLFCFRDKQSCAVPRLNQK